MMNVGVVEGLEEGRGWGMGRLGGFEFFEYAERWRELGREVAEGLSPYVAVHWRVETLDPAILPACSDALVDALAQLVQTHPSLHTVYLATDYPIEALQSPAPSANLPAHSLTFTRQLTPLHHAAFRAFLATLATRLPALRLTTLAQEQAHARAAGAGLALDGDVGALDPALVGIVDKLVAGRAEVFVAGAPEAGGRQCAKASSFTLNILREREEGVRGQGGVAGEGAWVAGRLWNVAEEFGRGTGDGPHP